MTSAEAWRYQLRAEGIERRPPPADRGYVEQPGEQDKPRSSLLIPLSVIRDEEEKAIMAELLEEERTAKQQAAQEAERPSGIQSLPPAEPPLRRRIVTRGDLNPERKPLRASLGDIAQFSQPENEITMSTPPDDIDRQIQAMLAKHEEQQRQSERQAPPPPPEPPKEQHQTLLSRPQPPPEAEEFQDYHEAPTDKPAPSGDHILGVGSDGRTYYTKEYRDATAREFVQRREAGEQLTLAAFAESKGIGPTLLTRWLQGIGSTVNWARERWRSEPMPKVTGKPTVDGRRPRRFFEDQEKLDILDKVDQLQKDGHSFKAACDEVDVVYNIVRQWQAARSNGSLKRPRKNRPVEAAPQAKRPNKPPSDTLPRQLDDDNEVRDVGTVMAELAAAKERVKQLKAELIELL